MWKSHGWRSLVGCSPWGRWGSDTTERLHFHFSFSCIGERNGNPLQCSCLENPRDGGAWWAAVCGVAQSRTRLKWLSSSICMFTLMEYMWYMGFPGDTVVKNLPGNPGKARDAGSIPESGNGNPLQRSCLGNPRDRGAWWAAVCGVAQSRTRLKRLSSSSSILVKILLAWSYKYKNWNPKTKSQREKTQENYRAPCYLSF